LLKDKLQMFWNEAFVAHSIAVPGFAWRNCGWSTNFFSYFSKFPNRDSKQTPPVTIVKPSR